MIHSYFKGRWYSRISSFFYWLFVKIVEWKARGVYSAFMPKPISVERVEVKR